MEGDDLTQDQIDIICMYSSKARAFSLMVQAIVAALVFLSAYGFLFALLIRRVF